MIEFKARGNGLLEARANGSMMLTLHLINFSMLIFELNCIIIYEQMEISCKNCYEIN